jgi:hypothetical protein
MISLSCNPFTRMRNAQTPHGLKTSSCNVVTHKPCWSVSAGKTFPPITILAEVKSLDSSGRIGSNKSQTEFIYNHEGVGND